MNLGGIFLMFLVLLSCHENNDHPDFEDALTIEENVDNFVQNYVNDSTPGVSVLVRKGDKIILKKSYGLVNLETRQPINSDTPFYLASVSKQFAAMSTMLLYEEDKLNFDDKITDHLEEAPELWSQITIHHLLTHRSGIPDYLNDLEWYRSGLTNQNVLDDLVKLTELEFEPGSKFDYSNSGYVLLAIITSRVSGMPFQDFMRENIFSPLNMNNSLAFDESRPDVKNVALSYNEDKQLVNYELLTMGDGGMFSTINDLDKWEQSFYTDQLINDASKELAFTSHHSDEYGYGWGIRKIDDHDHYAHGGGLLGYRTLISRIPGKQFSIIILSNGSYGWIYKLRDEILRVYL
jgi:CubicO group peptidase (beta-lactamase class C family)